MSGGGGGVIIINKLVNSGQFTPDECTKLNEIKDRSIVHCSLLDAMTVAAMVFERLRKP